MMHITKALREGFCRYSETRNRAPRDRDAELYMILVTIAAAGEPIPTDRTICETMGNGPRDIRKAMLRLAKSGRIIILASGRYGRQIEIVASGDRTAAVRDHNDGRIDYHPEPPAGDCQRTDFVYQDDHAALLDDAASAGIWFNGWKRF